MHLLLSILVLTLVVREVHSLCTGTTVIPADDAYRRSKTPFSANVYIQIENYSKWTLSMLEYNIHTGISTAIPRFILPAHIEAFSATHLAEDDGTGGYIMFTTWPNHTCVVEWKVAKHTWPVREPNTLAYHCFTGEMKYEDISYSNVYDIKYGETYQRKSSYCMPDCIIGYMENNYHSKVTIKLYPADGCDFAPNARGRVYPDRQVFITSHDIVDYEEYTKNLVTECNL